MSGATRPLRIGLTGGIASGKSAVSAVFSEELGVPVIDTDAIAREVVEPGTGGLAAVVEAFGGEVLDAGGRLDRRALRKRVFANDAERRRLEAILHPLIRKETRRRAETAGGPYQVFVVPLLAESDFRDYVDRVLVVDCPPELQLERLIARDGETREGAERMLAAQASRETRLGIADDVIVNDGTLAELREAVVELDARYRKAAENARAG